MLEEDGFIYRRLSIGKESPTDLEMRHPLKKKTGEGTFFNFKFVNRKMDGGISFLFEKRGEEIGKNAIKAREKTRKTTHSIEEHKSCARAAEVQFPSIAVQNHFQNSRAVVPVKSVKFNTPTIVKDPLLLHTLLKPEDTLDTLVGLTVDLLKQKLGRPPFLDQLRVKINVPSYDLEESLEALDQEVAEINTEITKWGDVCNETRQSAAVSVDFTFQDFRIDEIRSRNEQISTIREDFKNKENQLMHGMKGLNKIVDNAQAHCEDLFRKILRAVERSKGYDSLVLLRAISKLGK